VGASLDVGDNSMFKPCERCSNGMCLQCCVLLTACEQLMMSLQGASGIAAAVDVLLVRGLAHSCIGMLVRECHACCSIHLLSMQLAACRHDLNFCCSLRHTHTHTSPATLFLPLLPRIAQVPASGRATCSGGGRKTCQALLKCVPWCLPRRALTCWPWAQRH
jgi:hypothetical protein